MPSPFDILIPAAVSMIVLLISWRPWSQKAIHGRWGGPIALALGFVSMYAKITGAVPTMPPNSAIGWLFYIAIVAALLGLINFRLNSTLRSISAIVILAASFSLVLRSQLISPDSRFQTLFWIGGLTIVAFGWWIGLERGPLVTDRLTAPLAMFLIAIFSSVLLVMSHSMVYGRLGLLIAGSTAPMIILALWSGRFTANGSAIVFVAMLGMLLVAGYFYADLTSLSFALIAVAPLMLFANRLPLIARMRPRFRTFLLVVLTILPLALAVALTMPQFLRTMSDDTVSSVE